MKLSEHKELKLEILALPPKEKDKLLLRLIAKDKVLTEHLHFLLLEDESNLRDRISAIKTQIEETMEGFDRQRNINAKEVLSSLRKLSKLVNHNLRVTKANFEDVDLRLFLFNKTPTSFKSGMFSTFKNHEQIFITYFLKSTLVTLKKFDRLHEDLQYDLQQEVNTLLSKIYKSNMATQAQELGLPTTK